MSDDIAIAVVGATGLVGRAVIQRLSESALSTATVYPLASRESDGQSIEFGRRRLTVHDLEDFDFGKVRIAFFCVPSLIAARYIPAAVARGCWVIDHSACSRQSDTAALVDPRINPQDIGKATDSRLLAVPDSAVASLGVLLVALSELTRAERINMTMLRPVSDRGKRGIDELSKQAIALFNLKPIVHEVFDQQMAFNLLCSSGSKDYDIESSAQHELQRLMHDYDIQLNTTVVYVPVFYGHSIVLHVELSEQIDLPGIKDLIKKSPDLFYIEEQNTVPSPIFQGANKEGVYIGRLRKDKTWERGINLWMVSDNVLEGSAISGVQLAEILVKDYL